MLRSTVVDVRRGRVQPRCDDAQLRPRLGHARLPADRLRGHGSLPRELTIGLNFGEKGLSVTPEPIKPLASIPPTCVPSATDAVQARCRSTTSPRSSCSTSSKGTWMRLPRFQSGAAVRRGLARPLRGSDLGDGAGPVRQRLERWRRVLDRRVDQRGHRMSAIVRTEGLVKRYDRTRRGGRHRPRHRPGRDLRAGRAQRRRQDHDAADARDAAAARRRAPPRSTAGRSPGTPTRCVASSASCRTSFGVYDDMKVWEYLDFFARCYGLPAAGRRRMIGDLLELVDLGEQARRLRPGPVARDAAAAVPGPRARPRPAGAAPRRAGVGPRPARPGRAARAAPRAALDGQDDRHQQPHPARARGAVHERRDRRSRPGPGPGPGRRHRAAAALRRRPARPASCSRARRSSAARDQFAADPDVASATILDDGTIELGFRGDDAASARLLAGGGRGRPAGRRASRGPRATSRSCSSRSPPAEPQPGRGRVTMTDDGDAPTHRGGRRATVPEPAPVEPRPPRRPSGTVRRPSVGPPAGSARSASRSCAAGCAAGGRS